MPRRPSRDRPLALMVSRRGHRILVALTLVPLPGVGAAILGWRNPHTRLLRNGLMQATLVLLGSWPLVVPGAIGLAWAIWDGVRIAKARRLDLPQKNPSTT